MNQAVQRSINTRLPGAQWVGGQFVNWGKIPTPIRQDRTVLRGTLMAASMVTGLLGAFAAGVTIFPGVSGLASAPFYGVAHLFDRAGHSVKANDEMGFRAKFYTQQIHRVLGIKTEPGKYATVSEFKEVAERYPESELAKFYNAPLKEASAENKKSLLINGGIVGASTLMGAGGALAGAAEVTHHAIEGIKVFGEAGKVASVAKGTMQAAAVMARDGSGSLAGGALARVLTKSHMDSHELVEALDKSVTAAHEQGIDVAQVATPELIFALRVAQDEEFSDTLKKQYGKSFHQLDAKIQDQVMMAYPALANAATSEASAIKQGILPVKELAASKPNLNSMAQKYAVGAGQNSSFATMVRSRQEAANDAANPDSNVRSHMARLNAQRAAQQAPIGRKA